MTFKQVMLKQVSLSFLLFADVLLSKDSVFTFTNVSARHTFEKRHFSVHFPGWKETNNRFSSRRVKKVWKYANFVFNFMIGVYLTTEMA